MAPPDDRVGPYWLRDHDTMGVPMARRDIERTIAIRAAELASEQWRFHVKQCATCTAAVRDERPKRICTAGWPLASREAHTRVALDQLRERRKTPPRDEQLAMF